YTVNGKTVQAYDYSNFEASGTYGLSGVGLYLFADPNRLLAVSTLDGGTILEWFDKEEFVLIAEEDSPGVKLNDRVVDVAYDHTRNAAYAVDTAFHRLHVIDLGANAVTNTVQLPHKPLGVTISEDGTKLYVVNHDENALITELDA